MTWKNLNVRHSFSKGEWEDLTKWMKPREIRQFLYQFGWEGLANRLEQLKDDAVEKIERDNRELLRNAESAGNAT